MIIFSALTDHNDVLRTWLSRRLVLTRDTIAFAQPDDDIMIDYIPLAEVEAIRIMETHDENLDFIKASSVDSKSQSRGSPDCCSMLIKTSPDGQNGGRDYYLRADTAETCKAIVCTLEKAAISAKFRADANSRFTKSQFAVRKIHVSGPFHYTSAFLIAAVSAVWPPSQSHEWPPSTISGAEWGCHATVQDSHRPIRLAGPSPLFHLFDSARPKFSLTCRRFPRQNFVLSVSDAQYEEHMVKNDGSPTLLGRLNDQLNLVTPQTTQSKHKDFVCRHARTWRDGRTDRRSDRRRDGERNR